MWRKLMISLAALATFGPALSFLYVISKRWAEPAAKYPDLHTIPATVAIVLGWFGLIIALDLVLQILRSGRRLSHSLLLCSGVAAGCAAGLFGLWVVWLTPLRLWLLIACGPEIAGLFYLLYLCRRTFELRLFGIVFSIAGLILFVFAMREVFLIGKMADWVKAEGRVTDSGGSSLHRSKFWTKRLVYEYVVDGQRYVGCEDSWASSRMRHGWGKNLRRPYASYVWNEEVIVYHDPLHPERAVLRPGLSYPTAFILKASLLSILGGMLLLVAAAQLRRTKAFVTSAGGIETTDIESPRGALATEYWAGRVCFAVLVLSGLVVIVGIRPIGPDAMKIAKVSSVPVTADGFCRRGLGLLHDDDPKRAINNFTRALRLDPNDAAVYYNRGHAHVQMGQVPQAIEDWRRAIQLDWRLGLRVYYAWRRLAPVDPELGELIIRTTLDHVGDLREVSGYAVGAMGEAGEFYTASLILSPYLRDEDFLSMARNENPMIRAMALISLASRDITRHQAVIQSFYNDTAEVRYVPMGCGVSLISLSTLSKDIIKDPNMLQYWAPEKTKWLWDSEKSE